MEQFGGEGKPLFIGAIADAEASFPSDFKVLSNGVILDEVAVKVGAESSAVKRCPNWKLPVAVKASSLGSIQIPMRPMTRYPGWILYI